MKRRFEFRLERLRRVRALEEHVARAERARAEGEARTAEARADALRAKLTQDRAWVRERLAESALAPLSSAHRTLDTTGRLLGLRAEAALAARAAALRAAEEHRTRKVAARALDELRARARLEHLALLAQDEQAQMDEIALRRASTARGKAEGDSSAPAPATDLAPDSPSAPRP